MSPRKVWGFNPDSGGIKIPASVKNEIEGRINNIAEKHFKGKYTRLDIRFKGQFCYIDAFQEPEVSEDWPPKDWHETREEYIERLRKTPTHLCRLRYFGNVRLAWEIRGQISKPTIDLMRDLGIIHCTDISKEMPAFDSDILYTRLFGHRAHNLYQFDDAELKQIDELIKEKNPGKAYLSFHGARMYKDAARLKVYQKSRTFPNVTKTTGLESVRFDRK